MRLFLILTFLGVMGCSGDDTAGEKPSENNSNNINNTNNAGSDMSGEPDLVGDQGDERDCVQLEATDTWTLPQDTDVSVEYATRVTPNIEGSQRELSLLFERYSPLEDIGTFELGQGQDENFGDCAHCVFIRSDARERAFFADRGTLTTRVDPYSRRADLSVTNLRLVEVEVGEFRESTPVEGGKCFEVADFSLDRAFPLPRWTCSPDLWKDGQNCQCECGELDPDCNTPSCLPGMDCTPQDPLPVQGCEETEVCTYEPISFTTKCFETCDWENRVGCDAGTCLYETGIEDGALCINEIQRLAPDVAIGEACPVSNLQIYCNVNDGFAEGYCGPANTCRSICERDEDCTEPDHTCRIFSGTGEGLGYCGPEPTDG